jgi:hypothetical protein
MHVEFPELTYFNPEDGSSMFLENIGIHLHDMKLQPRRPESEIVIQLLRNSGGSLPSSQKLYTGVHCTLVQSSSSKSSIIFPNCVKVSDLLPIYLSMALQPLVGPWPLFQFIDLFTSR